MAAKRITVTGIVQGVGFRPFIYRIAVQNDLAGSVKNLGDAGVEIIVQGEAERIERFLADLRKERPPLAEISSINVQPISLDGQLSEFTILPSGPGGKGSGTVPPDVAICEDCLDDIMGRPGRTRYHAYWATSCVNCGPRFTVICGLPYDRERTSMVDFPMCDDCRKEYTDPLDRRYHAQTIACPRCGPRLSFNGRASPDPIAAAVRALQAGRIVAIKGIGGTHLACDATREEVVSRLRERCRRPSQPFAVMATEEMLRRLAVVSEEELALLRSWRRPIVILERREDVPPALAPSIAPGLQNVGIMLPYSGLHHLIFERIGTPLVMTSANLPGEPMLIEDEAIRRRLEGIADDFLLHDRRIVARCDDSVVRFSGGNVKFIRRSRGWAPAPIEVPLDGEPILALGAELQNTIALYADGLCYVSQHIGDVDDLETLDFLRETVGHLLKVTGLGMPRRVACDRHPHFLTTRLARELGGSVIRVQHHQAHIASVMGEHGLQEAIGIAVDGIGYGYGPDADGRIWGGEVLAMTRAEFEKVGGLSDVWMPGGDLATRYPARMVAGILYAGGLRGGKLKEVLERHVRFPKGAYELAVVLRQLEVKANTFRTSSAGRFLDATSALLGLCEERTYEGEPAMRLEAAAVKGKGKPIHLKPAFTAEGGRTLLDVPDLFGKLLELKEQDYPVADIAATAQDALARGLAQIALQAARERGVEAICLSGGVAYNDQITRTIRRAVERAGCRFYANEKVPCGDGGIAFGQVIVAAST